MHSTSFFRLEANGHLALHGITMSSDMWFIATLSRSFHILWASTPAPLHYGRDNVVNCSDGKTL